MKNIKITIVAFAALFIGTTSVQAQAVEEGNIVIDAYYGFPNLYTAVFKTTYANSGTAADIKIGGIGPLGARVEYLLTDKIGLGLDLGYNNSKVDYTDIGGYDNNGNPINYEYNFKTQKIGAMVFMNYHFLDNDKVDFFGTFGVGYGNRSYKFSSTDPDYVTASIKSLIPVASRIGVGLRYFFTDNLGANLGLGFGQGGLVNVGISAKF